MVAVKKIITVTFVALAFTATACANMTAVASLAAVPVSSPAFDLQAVSGKGEAQSGQRLALSAERLAQDGWPSAADLDTLPVASLPEAQTGEAPAAQAPQVLADHQSSLTLCLYVLMGVGLCKTVPSVRKMSLGGIPDWYHTGGPFQVGHSQAVQPDLRPVPVLCFLQPQIAAGDLVPKYDRRTIASLVRESLFRPDLLASRGPPLHSC